MSRPRLLAVVVATAALVAALAAPTADARVEADSEYTKKQTYAGALRYLRVELGYEITERDPDAAYLLFKYPAPGSQRTTNGALEIVESRSSVKILVRLPQMPAYHEQMLSEGLLKKLREDYGDPPRRSREEKPPATDAGSERKPSG